MAGSCRSRLRFRTPSECQELRVRTYASNYDAVELSDGFKRRFQYENGRGITALENDVAGPKAPSTTLSFHVQATWPAGSQKCHAFAEPAGHMTGGHWRNRGERED